MQSLKDQDILQGLLRGDNKRVEYLYDQYKHEFVHWSARFYSLEEEVALDVFQEAVITLYYNARQGKLQQMSSSLKTYLFAIGRNLLLKHFRKQAPVMQVEELGQVPVEELRTDVFEVSERQQLLARAVEKMGSPCRDILRLFYFENYSMEAIAERLEYKNENVAKSQKLRCLNELKKALVKIKDDLL